MRVFGHKLHWGRVSEGACGLVIGAVILYLVYKISGHDLVGFTEDK